MVMSMLRRIAQGAIASTVVAGSLVLGSGTAFADLNPDELQSITDSYLYRQDVWTFQSTRAAQPYGTQLDWSSDGCTSAPDYPFGYNFLIACHRHDFGYRNYKRQGRFNEATRQQLDNMFHWDLQNICGGSWWCNVTADTYYSAVRDFGN